MLDLLVETSLQGHIPHATGALFHFSTGVLELLDMLAWTGTSSETH